MICAVLLDAHRLSPASPLTLVGFSLGGNMVLKLAGEAATVPVPGLAQVAAVPPVDLEQCVMALTRPHNRLYEMHFVRDLVRLARHRKRIFPDDLAAFSAG